MGEKREDYGIGKPYREETLKLLSPFIGKLLSPAERRAYALVFIRFGMYAGCDLLDAPAITFSQFFNELMRQNREGLMAYSTILKTKKILAAFIRYCIKEKESGSTLVPRNFSDRMKAVTLRPLPEITAARDVPALTELDALIGYLGEHDRMVLAALFLSVRCFLKMGEMLRLTSADVFEDTSGEMFLRVAGRDVPVHIPSDLKTFISGYTAAIPQGGCLFPHPKKGAFVAMSAPQLDYRLKKACLACADEGTLVCAYTFNQLRFAAGTYAYSDGADALLVGNAMGYRTRGHVSRLTTLCVPLRPSDDLVNIYYRGGSRTVSSYKKYMIRKDGRCVVFVTDSAQAEKADIPDTGDAGDAISELLAPDTVYVIWDGGYMPDVISAIGYDREIVKE